MQLDVEKLKTEIEKLRERWKLEPKNRDIIEIQGKALRRALEIMQKGHTNTEKDSYENAKEIFGSTGTFT
jgi:hypothetical protein